MICPQCQRENLTDAIFCDHCGARLETACPECGELNRGGATFCKKCGHRLDRVGVVALKTEQKLAASDVRIPRHLAEKILASRPALEGERKQVTVLFADIRGSTSLLEGLDPEEAQKLIDPVLRVMMDAVHRYEGTVNQVLGDGIMALFGAPLAHEDHAVRACYTALAMQEEMRRYRRKLGQSEESGLQIGIGLNSGEVVVRSISNDLNVDYSALGHTTHMAARMQELARGGTTLMTSSTLRQVEGFVQVSSVGAVQVKGVSRPVEAFEVVAATAARTRVQAAAVRGLTPLVGRRTEIEVFSKRIEDAASGRGQILAMVGEPGLGKSRLVHEFTQHQLRPGWLVLDGASVSYGKATPYFPLIAMLHQYFQIADGAGSETIRDQVVMHILELDNMLKDTIPPILSLLDALPDEKITWPVDEHSQPIRLRDIGEMIKHFNSMDPQQRRRYTLDAVKRVLIRESQRQPLLAVFEDLHWVDSETQAFLDGLVESLPTAKILVLVNYRPGYTHSWSTRSYYTQLRVDPLRPASVEELLQHLLGSNADLAPLKELLIRRTEGNPFFAEESVRSLVEAGVLVGEKAAYRPGLRIDEIRIPSTVQNVVADRIDRLPIDEKHLLQTAAVIGVAVPVPLLQAVSSIEEDTLRGYLAHLQAAEFLYETKLFPEVQYEFKHALTAEVAYGTLLHDRRVTLHALVLQALEASTQSNDHAEKLAHHAFNGQLWDKSVTYLTAAASLAVSRCSFRNAVLHFERALDALRHLPRSHDNLGRGVDLRIEIRSALFVFQEFRRGFEYLKEAREMAESLGDRDRLGKVLTYMAAHWNLEGNSEQAVTTGRLALQYTEAQNDVGSTIVAHNWLGIAYHNLGRFASSIDELQKALSLVQENQKLSFFGRHHTDRGRGTSGIVSVNCKGWLIRSLAQIGNFHETLRHGEDAISIANELQYPLSIVLAYYAVGVVALIKGDIDQAIAALERSLTVCEKTEIPVQRPLVVSCLAAAYAHATRFAEAVELLESVADRNIWVIDEDRGSLPYGKVMRIVWEVEAFMLTDQGSEAEALARRVLEVSRESKDRGSEAWLLCLLGDLLARHHPADLMHAEVSYKEALTLAQELGMRPVQARCCLGLGRVHARLNDVEKARSELLKATELYRLMSMPFWLSKAEAALGELS